jgi:hypothetical protein
MKTTAASAANRDEAEHGGGHIVGMSPYNEFANDNPVPHGQSVTGHRKTPPVQLWGYYLSIGSR